MYDKTHHDAQCSKSRALTKVIDLFLEIKLFDKAICDFVSVRAIEKNMATIGVDQSLSNSEIYEHRCLENIKKLYKYAGKMR